MAKKNKRRVGVSKGTAAMLQNFSISTTKLDVRQIIRKPLDLGNWRTATRAAESIMMPRRVLLYDMYHDVMLDGHVIAVIGKRIDAITTAKWQFVDKDGVPVDEVNELMDSLGAADLLTEIMLSRFWGYSMVECNIYQDEDGRWEMKAEQYDRKHMRPEKGMITFDQNGEEGFSIREGRYYYTVVEAGKPRDLGLLISAAQYAILKRGNISDWANFIEVFGQPIMDAEWDGFDEDQRLKLLESLEAMGNSGKLVRPAGTKVEFLQQSGTATGQLQDSFKDAMNAEISKALLGSTQTVESSKGSGYAQSKEHGEQDDKKNETDIDFVRRHLNSRFIRVMRAFGLPVDGGKFIIPDAKKQLTPTEQFEMWVRMFQILGMPVDHDTIYELTGMKKPDDYDAQMAAKKAQSEAETQEIDDEEQNNNANTPGASKPKNGKKPGNAAEKNDKKPDNKQPGRGKKLALALIDFFGLPRM